MLEAFGRADRVAGDCLKSKDEQRGTGMSIGRTVDGWEAETSSDKNEVEWYLRHVGINPGSIF